MTGPWPEPVVVAAVVVADVVDLAVVVAGSGADGIAGRYKAGPGDAYYYRANATVGYYSAPNVKSRILCIRSWQPGLQPGPRPK